MHDVVVVSLIDPTGHKYMSDASSSQPVSYTASHLTSLAQAAFASSIVSNDS